MRTPIFRYNYFWELVKDLENGKKIYCKHGRVLQAQISSTNSTDTGFILLNIEYPRESYMISTRYAYDYKTFLSLNFSECAQGLYYYIYVKNIGHYWDFALLDKSAMESYEHVAETFGQKGLAFYWIVDIPVAPKVQNVKAIGGDKKIYVWWDEVPGTTTYKMYFQHFPDVTTASIGIDKDIKKNYHIHLLPEGVENGTEYYLKVTVDEPNRPTFNPLSEEFHTIPGVSTILNSTTDELRLIVVKKFTWLVNVESVTGTNQQLITVDATRYETCGILNESRNEPILTGDEITGLQITTSNNDGDYMLNVSASEPINVTITRAIIGE